MIFSSNVYKNRKQAIEKLGCGNIFILYEEGNPSRVL